MPKRARLIYNPNAGQNWNPFDPKEVQEYLSKYNWKVEISPTQEAGHGKELAAEAAKDKYDVVIAAGGDGTINEVIQGLANTDTAMGFLPVGTTNVLAREFKISLDHNAALEYLPVAKTDWVDLGQVNDRYFILMAGIGYDAEILQGVDPEFKKLTGGTAVFTSGVKNLFNHSPVNFKIQLVDEEGKTRKFKRQAMQIFISNASTYATDYKIAEDAKMDDGLLEVHIFKSKRFRDTFYSLVSLALRKHKQWVDFEHFSVREISVQSAKPTPIQVDGDLGGETPALIKISPKSLKLLTPRPLDQVR